MYSALTNSSKTFDTANYGVVVGILCFMQNCSEKGKGLLLLLCHILISEVGY